MIPRIVLFLIKVFGLTYRMKVTGQENIDTARQNDLKAFSLSIWHENIVSGLLELGGKGIGVMISQSKDGEMINWVAERFGMLTYRGSSSKGGSRALADMMIAIKKGANLVLTVDGPRGPRRKVKRGIIEIAYKTKTPIVPFVVVPKNAWIFNKSWDHFNIPKPFSKIICHYGEPIYITEEIYNQGLESVSEMIENRVAQYEEELRNS